MMGSEAFLTIISKIMKFRPLAFLNEEMTPNVYDAPEKEVKANVAVFILEHILDATHWQVLDSFGVETVIEEMTNIYQYLDFETLCSVTKDCFDRLTAKKLPFPVRIQIICSITSIQSDNRLGVMNNHCLFMTELEAIVEHHSNTRGGEFDDAKGQEIKVNCPYLDFTHFMLAHC